MLAHKPSKQHKLPCSLCSGALAAARGGRLQDVTAFLLDSAAPSTLLALHRSWTSWQQQGGGGGREAADISAGDAVAADGELLFYISREGDATVAAGAASDDGEGSEDGSGEDGGLDLDALPGSGGESESGGGSEASGSEDGGSDADA